MWPGSFLLSKESAWCPVFASNQSAERTLISMERTRVLLFTFYPRDLSLVPKERADWMLVLKSAYTLLLCSKGMLWPYILLSSLERNNAQWAQFDLGLTCGSVHGFLLFLKIEGPDLSPSLCLYVRLSLVMANEWKEGFFLPTAAGHLCWDT